MDLIKGEATGLRGGEKWCCTRGGESGGFSLSPDIRYGNIVRLGVAQPEAPRLGLCDSAGKTGVHPEPEGECTARQGRWPLQRLRTYPRLPGKPFLLRAMCGGFGETAFEPVGTPNEYDPANAWTDAADFLHLKIGWETGTPEECRVSAHTQFGGTARTGS